MGRENSEKKVVVKDTEKNLNLYFFDFCLKNT